MFMILSGMKEKLYEKSAVLTQLSRGYWVLTEFKHVIVDQQGGTVLRPEVFSFNRKDIEQFVAGHVAEADGGHAILDEIKRIEGKMQ
jgi:hypothetical protein